jgi:sarcosine oxidase, subunit beta
MNSPASVVIIGGGVAGTSIAYHLGLKGQKEVLLLEQNALASGSSSKSDGIVERQLISEFDIILRVKSFEIFRDLFGAMGVPFYPIGYLRLTSDEKDVPKYLESVRIQRTFGVMDSKFLRKDEIREILPFINAEDLVGALYGPSDGMTDGSVLATTFAREAEKLGVRIVQKVTVQGIKKRNSGRRRYEVETSEGRIECDRIVNAAGAWSRKIGELIGAVIPVKAVRRQIVVLQVPYKNAGKMPFFIDMKSRLYMHGSGGGNIVHSGIHQDTDVRTEPGADADRYDAGVDFKFQEEVAAAIESRAPGLSGATVKGGWAGLYEITPDSRPILGELSDLPGFFNCTGFSGYGIQLSPIAGKLTSELIVDGRTETIKDISALDVGRFSESTDYSLF